jgi:ABC-type transport system involved in cytochrome c biogenesis permease subunit
VEALAMGAFMLAIVLGVAWLRFWRRKPRPRPKE